MMKTSFFRIAFFTLFFSLFIPFCVNATYGLDGGIVPNDYIDIGIPEGIALSNSGERVYVVDNMNSKILVFDSTGVLLQSIGRRGSGDADFDQDIYDITVDNNNYLYVSGMTRVWKISSTGAFVSKWDGETLGEGNFGEVRGIHYDESQNRIILSDINSDKVLIFSKDGTFIKSFGSEGSDEGKINAPYGLTTDSLGNIFVVDSDNHRVQKFNKDGVFVDSFGSDIDLGGKFKYPKDIEITSNGSYFYITSQNSQKVVIYKSDGTFDSEFGAYGGSEEQFRSPKYIALDDSDNVYVTDWTKLSVQKFSPAGDFSLIIGNSGKSDGKFYFPTAIAYDSSAFMYVLDDGAGESRVQKFSSSGDYISTIIPQEGDSLYASSYYMAMASDDYLYISGDQGVRVYDTAGAYQGAIGADGTDPGQFKQARGMDFDTDGNIYIADFQNNTVNLFDLSEGVEGVSLAGSFTGDGAGGQAFTNARAVLVEEDEFDVYVYVSDEYRIQKFQRVVDGDPYTYDFSYIGTIIERGEDLSIIEGMEFVDEGRKIAIADSGKNKIIYIVEDVENPGTWIVDNTYGDYGSGLDKLYRPGGINLNDNTGLLSIADTSNHRIFFKPDGARVSGLSADLDIVRTDNDASIVDNYVLSNDENKANLEAWMFSVDSPIAIFNIDMSDNRDWSAVTVSALPEKAKVLKLGLDGAPGIIGTIDLFVPKYDGQEKLLVCPDVTSLKDIELGCEGGYILTIEDEGVTTAEFDGQNYWVLTDFDETGFMSYSTSKLELATENTTIYVDETLNLTITPIGEGGSLDTNYVGNVEIVSTPYLSTSHSVVAINKPTEAATKQLTFSTPGVYTIKAEDVDDPVLADTLEDITVLGIQDSPEEEDDDNDDNGNNGNNRSNSGNGAVNKNLYATAELTCEEDPMQEKCTVLSYISDIVFTKVDNTSAKVCWNQTVESSSYLQLTEDGQPIGERIPGETSDGVLYCATILGLVDSMDYSYIITIDEVKDDANISGSYEGVFSMKDETQSVATDDSDGDLKEKTSGGNLWKTILIILGVAVALIIIFFLIIKRREEEEEDTTYTNR